MHGPDDAYYERARRWASSPRHRAELEALVAAMALRPGERVLDIGCGTGAALRLLADRGIARIGIDRSPCWPRFCAERPVAMADAATLPFAARSFDAAIVMHVFAHLADPGATLGEVARVLKPGGRLGILTPNRHFLAVYAFVPRWWNGYVPDATVERHYALAEVARLARHAGFEVVRAELLGKPPRLLPLARFAERACLVCVKPDQRAAAIGTESSTR